MKRKKKMLTHILDPKSIYIHVSKNYMFYTPKNYFIYFTNPLNNAPNISVLIFYIQLNKII